MPVDDELYMTVFRAAMTAAVDAAAGLPDDEVDRLSRYSGIVGLAAEHVRASRELLRSAKVDEA